MSNNRISVVGTVGVPAIYGGFETLVHNLSVYHSKNQLPCELSIYCSSKSYTERPDSFMSSRLRYIPLHANGIQSIPYDILSLLSAIKNRSDTILLLGVSGAVILPFVRLFSNVRIITNIDGMEWRRQKWRGFARGFLKFSEKLAVRYSDVVISDNDAIADHVSDAYQAPSEVIAYGGDHVLDVEENPEVGFELPRDYAFSVCRIEPENNIHMILEAFSRQDAYHLVLVGNWANSEYGEGLRERYSSNCNLHLIDPIYDLGVLKYLRGHAALYVHGHSAGGTNPSLVEAMHFAIPIVAYDCSFNRYTTEGRCEYFASASELTGLLDSLQPERMKEMAEGMLEIANRRYTWDIVARQYFDLLA